MSKYTCVLCKNKIEEQFITRVTSKNNIAVTLSALHVYTLTSIEDCLAVLNAKTRTICISHCVDAAQYLLADILASGGSLSMTAEGASYLNEIDIPADIPAFLSSRIRTFSNDLTVTISDVNRYLNTYLKKYFENGAWKIPQADDSEERRQHLETVMEEGQTNAEELLGCVMDYEVAGTSALHPQLESPTKSSTASPSKTILSIPSVRHTDSGSSTKTSGSCFTPSKMPPESDSEAAFELQENDPALLDRFYVVQGKKLLELFNLNRCGCRNDGESGAVRLTQHSSGAIPVIEYITKGPNPEMRKWEGQDKLGVDRKNKLYAGTTLACSAAITTGLRWTKLNHWATEANLLLPCRTAYYNQLARLIPSIETVYDKHQSRTIQQIKEAYENGGQSRGWNIAIDGAYDSRGHSAELCKVLAVDLNTGLCVHTEIVNRSQTGGMSGRMEKAGFHQMLRWFRSSQIPVHSVSTDRSYTFKSEIDTYNKEHGEQIKWYIDPWHLSKYLDKSLREVGKRKDCGVIRDWRDHIKAHLYEAIRKGAQAGDGEVIKHYFNTCIYHVAGRHQWVQEQHTGAIIQCAHNAVEGGRATIAWGSTAHNRLKDIVYQQAFQRDITQASPYGGTSLCESKNSLDRIYCPKEVYLPAGTYPLYTKLSTLHKNALREAELRGERVPQRVSAVQRKFSEHETQIEHKTPVEHLWRKEIWVDFLSRYLGAPSHEEEMDVT